MKYKIVSSIAQVEHLIGAKCIYLDAETTNRDKDLSFMAVDPYDGKTIVAGWALTVDDCDTAYYLPIRHHSTAATNLDAKHVNHFLWLLLRAADKWINHNIKYDANVWLNNTPYQIHCSLVDTLTLAKIIDSDRFRYSLKDLSKDWLEDDIGRYEDAMKPYL